MLGLVARTRKFKSASLRIFSASNRSLPTTLGTVTSGLRKERYTVVASPKRKATAMAITIVILLDTASSLAAKLTDLTSHPFSFTARPGPVAKSSTRYDGAASCSISNYFLRSNPAIKKPSLPCRCGQVRAEPDCVNKLESTGTRI